MYSIVIVFIIDETKKEIPVAKEYKKEHETDIKKGDEINVPKIDTSKESVTIGELNNTKSKDEKFKNKGKDIDKKINNNSKGENGTKEEIQKKTRPVKRPSDAKDEVIHNSNNQDKEDSDKNEESNSNEEKLNPGNIHEEIEVDGEWGNIIANMR